VDPTVFGLAQILTSRRFVITVSTLFITFPLSLYRDVSKLAKVSALALAAVVVIVVAVVVEGPQTPLSLRGDPAARWTWIQPGIFQSIGVISFAFVCHHNTFIIFKALAKPTLDRAAIVTHMSMFVSMVASLALGMAGFLVFTDRTQGNILNNFPMNNAVINFTRLCFGMNMFTTFPLEHFVAREVVEELLWPTSSFHAPAPPRWAHVTVTTVLVLLSLLVSLVTCDLGLMFELAGGTSAAALAFVLPAACYLKATAGRGRPWYDRRRIGKWLCIVFGLTVMIVNMESAIWKTWFGGGDKDQMAVQCHW